MLANVASREIMTADDVRRALVRIGHEIVEKHGGTVAVDGEDRRLGEVGGQRLRPHHPVDAVRGGGLPDPGGRGPEGGGP